ncbi:MAG TPA: hypothetical protein VMV69_08455 [Pirellulales bacterium]|nr:hypothetical protein [Pirellulales bacterium]
MVKHLLNTPYAQVVHDFFQHLAQGNEGSATVKKLDLDGTRLDFSVDVRHRQTAKIKIPFDGTKTIVLIDDTTNVSGTVDLLHPDPSDVNLRIDTPFGPIKFSILQLIEVLVEAGILA